MMKFTITLLFFLSYFNLIAQFEAAKIIAPDVAYPNNIRMVDVNEDGYIDIVGSDHGTYSIFWMANLGGSGDFSDPIILEDGIDMPRNIAIDDIDGDGHQDIIAISEDDNKIIWYRNEDGLGGFQTNLVDDNAEGPVSFHVTDIDGDGDMDIISAADATDKIVWYQNMDGQGTFSNKITLFESMYNVRLVMGADLDGDGDEDIIGALSLETVWFENLDGQGAFSAPTIITDQYNNPIAIDAKDIDGDNDIDFIFSTSNNDLVLAENTNGNGNFTVVQVDNTDDAWTVEIVDLDGDNDNDILTVARGDHQIIWYENLDGQGNFSELIIIEESSNGAVGSTAADIDNDGDPDVITNSSNAGKVTLYNNINGQADFSEGVLILSRGSAPSAIHINDFDGDGLKDIMAGFGINARLAWYKGENGLGKFSLEKTVATQPDNVNDLTTGDLDNDGTTDIVVAYNYADDVVQYKNIDGLGNFGAQFLIDEIESPRTVELADINNDNFQDLLYTGDGSVLYTLNNGFGGFNTPVTIYSDPSGGNCYSAFADIDGDNDLDIIAGCSVFGSKLMWFENLDGNGTYGPENLIEEIHGKYFAPGDIDNDGDLDILIGNTSEVYWIENLDGNGSFSAPIILFNSSVYGVSQIDLGDVDMDGGLDIVFTNAYYNYFMHNSDGNGNFSEEQKLTEITQGGNVIALDDIDTDGDLDIITSSGIHLIWYENAVIDNNAKINVQSYWDENENGNFDAGETTLNQQNIQLEPNAITSWTSGDGTVNFSLDAGDYELSLIPDQYWELTTPASIALTLTNNSGVSYQQFGLKSTVDIYDANIDLVSAATRCGFIVPFWLNYQNTGTQTADGSIMLELDPLVEFVDAEPQPAIINGNQLFWNFEDLYPTQSGQLKLHLQMPGVDFIGEQINMNSIIVLEDESGTILVETSDQFSSTINCAYDPNDKLVEPFHPNAPANYTLFGDTLVYTIRFQNTGTDTAFHVRLEDELDEDLNWSTFHYMYASHENETTLNENGLLVFYFRDILLPDSTTNEPASHGFVKFWILPKNDLEENTQIRNEAEIYFDFNPPIETNQTRNQMVSEYPLVVNATNPLCHNSNDGLIEIVFDIDSLTYQWDNGQTGQIISNLDAGTYSLTVTNSQGEVVSDSTFTLVAPPALSLASSSTPENNNNSDGTASVEASGGTPPYFYSWNTTPVQNTSVATNLTTGTYTVTVSDANGCDLIEEVFVDLMVATEDIPNLDFFTISPNPAIGEINLSFQLKVANDWRISIINNNGRIVGSYKSQQSQKNGSITTILPAGFYIASLESGESVINRKFIILK